MGSTLVVTLKKRDDDSVCGNEEESLKSDDWSRFERTKTPQGASTAAAAGVQGSGEATTLSHAVTAQLLLNNAALVAQGLSAASAIATANAAAAVHCSRLRCSKWSFTSGEGTNR